MVLLERLAGGSVLLTNDTTSLKMTSLEPFSPPFCIDRKAKRTGCYMNVDGVPHEASWTGDWGSFDFTDTSLFTDFRLSPLQLSTEIMTIWKGSRHMPWAFGSHASVRSEGVDSKFVVKIAHPNDKCRRLVEREFNIMRDLSNLDAVAKVAGEPLADKDGIFGFRLERLGRVELKEFPARLQEVESLLDSLHDTGYCHGDCSFSNIMQNREGKLVLIDMSLSGPLESDVPEEFQGSLVRASRYTADIDREMIKRCANYGR
jgi:hypothetical protein